MTTPKRRSVSLNKAARGDMLHSFFRDITRQPAIDLLAVEHELALDIYDMIYGDMRKALGAVADIMLSLECTIPLPAVTIKRKKKKRVKGHIESSQREWHRFEVFTGGVSMDRTLAVQYRQDIYLPNEMPQVRRGSRYHDSHMETLTRVGLIDKRLLKLIEARYVKGVLAGRAITQPIVEAMAGVAEILSAIKTTKGLLSAWPGCEKYLELPEASAGVLVKVDIDVLDASLSAMYPPAEKNSLADEL